MVFKSSLVILLLALTIFKTHRWSNRDCNLSSYSKFTVIKLASFLSAIQPRLSCVFTYLCSSRHPRRPTSSIPVLKLDSSKRIIHLLFIIASDCSSLNPGPVKLPCGLCSKPVKRNQRAIECEECLQWLHVKCINMSTQSYNRHGIDSNLVWVCNNCLFPNFSTILSDNLNISTSNIFDSLCSCPEQDDAPSAPLFTSSPCISSNKKPRNIRILTINCNSLRSKEKQNQLVDLIETHNPDIICGQESKLDTSMKNPEIFPSAFSGQVFRKDYKAGERGVFIAVKEDILSSQTHSLQSDADAIWAKIEIQGARPLYVASVYRHTDTHPEAIVELTKVIEKLNDTMPNAVITGDFNVPSVSWSTNTVAPNPQYGRAVNQAVVDMAINNGLHQVQQQPTRINNTLDLVFVNNPNIISNIKVFPGMSDHECVVTDINLKVKHNKKSPRTVYRFSRGDMDAVKLDLQSQYDQFVNTNCVSVQERWNLFKSILMRAIKDFIPQKVLSARRDVPWLTPSIKRMIRRKQRLYNLQKRSGKEVDKQQFKEARRAVKKALNSAHDKYVLGLLDIGEENGDSPRKVHAGRKFWKYIKSLRRENISITTLKDNIMNEEVSNGKEKAEILSRQYESVFTVEDLTTLPDMSSDSDYPSMTNFTINTKGIEDLLKKINPMKANGPDMIPSRVLKECASQIAPYLTVIFNQSLSEQDLPEDWLTANVCPIYKKGERKDPANYRPVSLTCVICKVMEHIVYHHVLGHLHHHNILKDFQHGFRKGRSCESQLIITTEDIARVLDDRSQVDLLVLDFSKAFDTVPHIRLLKKLEYYGVKGQVQGWISAWLTNRSQRVTLDGECSAPVKVRSGVPQGTVLGPLMFLIYINDIGDDVTSKLRLFADDSLLYLAIETQQDAVKLQNDLNKLSQWASKWQMSFNIDKCKTLTVTKKRNPVQFPYEINNKTLKAVRNQSYLGVELTSNLNWNKHVENVMAKANKTLGFIKRNLKRCLEQVKVQAYTSLVRPHLEYASTVWSPHQKYQINSIEAVQRKAARFCKNCWDREPGTVTRLLQELNWETLQTRRERARLTLLFKISKGMVAIPMPPYVQHPHYSRTRQYHPERFSAVYCRTNTYKGSFSPATIDLWNKLPPETITKSSVTGFKNALN